MRLASRVEPPFSGRRPLGPVWAHSARPARCPPPRRKCIEIVGNHRRVCTCRLRRTGMECRETVRSRVAAQRVIQSHLSVSFSCRSALSSGGRRPAATEHPNVLACPHPLPVPPIGPVEFELRTYGRMCCAPRQFTSGNAIIQISNDTDVIRHASHSQVKPNGKTRVYHHRTVIGCLDTGERIRLRHTAFGGTVTVDPREGHSPGRRRRRRNACCSACANSRTYAVPRTVRQRPGEGESDHSVTAIVNVGDDAWMHIWRAHLPRPRHVHVHPWAAGSTRSGPGAAQRDLAREGRAGRLRCRPDWFVGDRDLATT